MTDPVPRVGIVFNAYEPRPVNTGERLSEESVADMAGQVHGAVKTLGYDATLIPLQRSLMNFLGRVKELNLDVLVNLCEGFYGRPQWESNVASVFELLGMAFTGSNSKTLGICQDKFSAKAVLAAYGLPTAPSQLVTEPGQAPKIRLPAIIKPNSEDASLGITPESVVRDAEAFAVQTSRVLEKYNQPALAEEFIDGREFNVAVYEKEVPTALPVSELDFSAMPGSTPHILSYETTFSTTPRRRSARRPSTTGFGGSSRRRPWAPSRLWDAATTPASISGWIRRGGSLSSRSIPIPTSA
jgi:D-alanine-D-alanine ligase